MSLWTTEARLIDIREDLDTIEFPNEVKELSEGELANKVMKNQIRLFNSDSIWCKFSSNFDIFWAVQL